MNIYETYRATKHNMMLIDQVLLFEQETPWRESHAEKYRGHSVLQAQHLRSIHELIILISEGFIQGYS